MDFIFGVKMNFPLLGALVNCGAVIIGSLLGLLFKKGIPEKVSDTVMKGMGLCVLWIGVTGAIKGQNALVMIFSLLFGAIIGELIDLDRWVGRLGDWIQKKVGAGHGNVTQGFVTATLLFCVGAMSVLGPIESGLSNDHTTQYTKSVLDFVSSVIYTSSLGIGVIFSALSVLLLQGSLTVLAEWVGPLLTDSVVVDMTAVGSLLIVGLALNMLGITKLKIMNYLPAVFLTVLFSRLYDIISAFLI